jgi:CHAT domain-containing protein
MTRLMQILTGSLFCGWLIGGIALGNDEQKKVTPEERKKLEAELAKLMLAAGGQFQEGKYLDLQKTSEAALDMARRLYPKEDYPDGHRELANTLNTLGVSFHFQGKWAEAESVNREALTMTRRLYKGDNADLADCLNNQASLLKAQGKLAEAEPLFREALTMKQQVFKGDHPSVSLSSNNLGRLLQAQGKLAEAELLFRETLAMDKRLFKGDHRQLAGDMNNLAFVLYDQGKQAEAEPLFRGALAMDRRQYKGDHPHIASGMSNLAILLGKQGKLKEAEALHRDALAMKKRLFKGDNPDLPFGLNNLAAFLQDQGNLKEAEPLYREALAMRQRLFQGDHPDVALSLSNLAAVLDNQGKSGEAEPLLRQALAMYRRLVITYARQKREGDALNLLVRQPLARDDFLSVAWRFKSEPASVYAEVLASKGAIARVFEERQQAARAAVSNPEAARLQADLASARRQRANLILAPQSKDPATRKERDESISVLAEKITGLERDLRPLLPRIARAEKLAAAGPADLQSALPADTALVDFLHYTFFERDPEKPGKEGKKWTSSYLAFVLTRERISWLNLGPAAPIEETVAAWREAILEPAKQRRNANAIAAHVRELVWAKVRDQLPASIKSLYIAPDLALCRLPWAALPGDHPGTILLEDFTLATFPHATFLLDQLWPQDPLHKPPAGLLVVGGVKYDGDVTARLVAGGAEPLLRSDVKGEWPFLNGTLAEAQGVVAMAERKKVPLAGRLEGREATTTAVLTKLPQAKYAHLATHGFFADPSFRSVFQIDPKEFEQSLRGERVGRAATSPLIMTGLVFAGANHLKTQGRGIVTGEALVDLDLSGLELAVLSACETGLGDVAGGEGTFGLQRAFHLAGTRNVLASLWKVPDEATAALMGRFYHKLWEEGLPPLDALRQAQLEIYRRPDRIAEWSKSIRGKFEVVSGSPETPPVEITPSKDGTTPAFYWAAFSLSGLGR